MIDILQGDCLAMLETLPDRSVQMCVTSPPYYNLRDYQTATWIDGDPNCDHQMPRNVNRNNPSDKQHTSVGSQPDTWKICGKCGAIRIDQQIGLEETPTEYVTKLTTVFAEINRILKDDGLMFLNIGDTYNNRRKIRKSSHQPGFNTWSDDEPWIDRAQKGGCKLSIDDGDLKEKDLIGIPWMLAFALRADGWYLRSDIIWHKNSVMPESVKDRPTRSYEHVFLLTKNPRYYYDADAIREPHQDKNGTKRFVNGCGVGSRENPTQGWHGGNVKLDKHRNYNPDGRNARDLWTINPKPFKGAHFATMPMELANRCIKAGSRIGDTIIDPFGGSGTTAIAASKLNRNSLLIELNPDYIEIAKRRLGLDSKVISFVP